jgi:cytochrome c oxidase subunit 2
MIERLIQPASSFASDIDGVILLIAILTMGWFFAAEGMFFWLLWRFRAREGVEPQYVSGKEPHLKRWINIPHALIIVCDVAIIVAAVRVWYNVKQNLPEADATIEIVAQQWAWSFIHPGADNQLGTADDIKTVDELHVEADKVYHFKLKSRDVLHSFSVPVFRLKQDAIPGRTITGWFQPSVAGQYDIQCAEMCGIGHGIMAARIFVDTPDAHAAWIASATH